MLKYYLKQMHNFECNEAKFSSFFDFRMGVVLKNFSRILPQTFTFPSSSLLLT